MKITAISCSPRKQGNTDTLIGEALTGAIREGSEISSLFLRDLSISPCDGCMACAKTGHCHKKDDMQVIYEAMEGSDGIIIGSPIYFWSLCGQAKVMLDRTIALRFPQARLANRVGGIIVSATRRGTMNGAGVLSQWMLSNHMWPADVVDGYATAKGAVRKDLHAMKAAFELGRLVAKLIHKGINYPEGFDHPLYRLTELKYNIKTCPVS
jgi:multimeric flavodoxin WrbA